MLGPISAFEKVLQFNYIRSGYFQSPIQITNKFWMKRILSVTALFFLVFCANAFAQSKKDVKKHDIKSITVKVYEPDQNGKEKTFTDSYQRFDKNGKLIEEIEYDKSGGFRRHESWKFNKSNDETEHTEYNDKAGIVKKTVTEFDSNNKKKSETVYDGTGQVIEKTLFTYNPDGEKITETTLNASGKTLSRSVFTYDNKGLKAERKTYNAAGQLVTTKKFSYEFH